MGEGASSTDVQLMHLCIKGTGDDSKYAEAEIDRREGAYNIPNGRDLSMEGVQALAAAGMAP
eukprot:1367601-Prymnesium_polylepis.2